MKILSKTSLMLALALGAAPVAMMIPATPAMAAKAPQPKISDAVRKPLIEVQNLLKKNDFAGALPKIQEAKALIKSEDDRFYVGQMMYDIGRGLKDNAVQAEAVDAMLQSGFIAPENRATYTFALGQLSYMNKDYAKAETAFGQVNQLDPANLQAYALAAETKVKLGKKAEAVALLQSAADRAQPGQPIPNEWYGRAIGLGMDAKLPAAVFGITMSWLKAYPTQTHWRDSLSVYRDLHTVDNEYSLDIMRLQRAAQALRGERDYVEVAEATYLKFPNEAKAVLDEGVAAGVLNLTQMRGAAELSTLAAGKVAADKASLSKNVPTAKSALNTADAYASYADYASAIELYRKALSLGGLDANLINTRLAVALFKSGQKDEAKSVFASITGPRADLAKYWLTFIDNPPTAD